MNRKLILLLCAGFIFGCAQKNDYEPPPPPSVTVAKPLQHDVTLYLEETGTTEAAQRIEIRARVSGYLEKVFFADTPVGGVVEKPQDDGSAGNTETEAEPDDVAEKVTADVDAESAADAKSEDIREGGFVEKGQLLYEIEPREYKARVSSAKATLGLANVELTRAGIELAREEKLLKDKATAAANVDNARAARDGAQAAVDAAKAELDRAQQDLGYTRIVAPISGRVERTLVKVGNLVGENEATHLTTVIQYDPIHVYFNISERALLRALEVKEQESNDAEPEIEKDITELKAYLRRSIDDGFPFEGNLDYADLGVDQSSGTFTVRAKFPNADERILPGLFVRIRVPVGIQNGAVLIPESAVGADQAGRYVIILDDKNTAERRNVELGAKFGEMIVIRDGLEGDETVVVSGLQRARPGATVTPNKIELEVPPELLEEVAKDDSTSPATDENSDTQEQTSAQSTDPESKDEEPGGDNSAKPADGAASDEESDEQADSPTGTSPASSVSTGADADADN